MLIKDINKLKRKMQKACDEAIDGIIDQMILNEDVLKISSQDPSREFKATKLNIKLLVDIKDPSDPDPKSWQIYCNPITDLE